VRKISENVLHKYRYLIFLAVYIIVSVILAFFYIDAISLNTGKDYWDVFKEAYLTTLFVVVIGSAGVIFATAVVTTHGVFEGEGGFIALVVVYIVMVAILGPVVYFGLLNFLV